MPDTIPRVVRLSRLLPLFLAGAFACAAPGRAPLPSGWYKGNTHTHSLWSDGDAAPETAVGW